MREYYRIIDANINRASEGLRVIEEYLRFIVGERSECERCKRYRHILRQIGVELGNDELLSARSADSDVGKEISSPSDVHKRNLKSIMIASFKRVEEALRSIEEYSKFVEVKVGKQCLRLRFEIYQLERDVMQLVSDVRFRDVRLYLLIGSDVCEINEMKSLLPALLEAGVDCVQLREKNVCDKEFFEFAGEMSDLVHRFGKIFIVNDRPDIAVACGADGVHIGQNDLPISVAREIVGSNRLVGVSTHNISQLERAIRENASYIAIGPVFETQTKPEEPVAGLDFVRQAVRKLRESNSIEVAIGGINSDNIRELLSLGVRRVALCSAILSCDEPVEMTRKFASLLQGD